MDMLSLTIVQTTINSIRTMLNDVRFIYQHYIVVSLKFNLKSLQATSYKWFSIVNYHIDIMATTGQAGIDYLFGDTYEAHASLMGAIWGPGINIAIFLAVYSYRKVWPIVHGLMGIFACIYSLACSLPILSTTGIIPASSTIDPEKSGTTINAHYLVGIASMCLIGIQLLLGIMTKLVNILHGKSTTILGVRKVHMILGYLMIIVCKSEIYIIKGIGDSAFFLTQDIIFLLLIIARKIFFPTQEKTIAPTQNTQPRLIKSIKELNPQRDYVVFANYVYDTEPLKMFHPAGYQIIESVKNKEIDRYIYGMYSSQELPEVNIHSHSYRSFTLMDDPVAKICIPSPIKGFSKEEIPVVVSSLKLLSERSQIYEMNLSGENDVLSFTGYTETCQLGQNFSITLNKKVTRLYTSVHFLNQDNKTFMQKHCPGIKDIDNVSQTVKILNKNLKEREDSTGDFNLQELTINRCINILFKAYPGGKFTDNLVKGPIEEVMLSRPKGEGLRFSHLKPGKILIVAGGTGLYPFSDLIDLLFKSQLIQDHPKLQSEAQKISPILAQNPFAKFSFHLLAAFQSISDIHPITLHQLLYLSARSQRFSLTLRLKEVETRINLQKVKLTTSGFQELLSEELRNLDGIQKVWICGPPRMNEGISKFLRETYKKPELYLIL